MFRIGMFSKIGKTTIKTLHYYEEVGLLRPACVDSENGYRFYTTDQLFDLHRIMALRQIGLSVQEISDVMNNRRVDEILLQRQSELERALAETSDRLSRINHYIENRKENRQMNYQALIKEISECVVFSKRMTIPNYPALNEVVPAIGKAITEANPGLKCAEPAYCFNIYHDGEYKESDIDVEFCEAVTKTGKEVDGIVFKTIPAATVATVMHKGPYRMIGGAYAFLFKWAEDNGYTIVDNPRESYIDGIWNKDSEDEWLTEVQLPVRKK